VQDRGPPRSLRSVTDATSEPLPIARTDSPPTRNSSDAVGARPATLHRLLRALSDVGVVQEREDGLFAGTPRGNLLRSDVPSARLRPDDGLVLPPRRLERPRTRRPHGRAGLRARPRRGAVRPPARRPGRRRRPERRHDRRLRRVHRPGRLRLRPRARRGDRRRLLRVRPVRLRHLCPLPHHPRLGRTPPNPRPSRSWKHASRTPRRPRAAARAGRARTPGVAVPPPGP
jgi:hypothetical protein